MSLKELGDAYQIGLFQFLSGQYPDQDVVEFETPLLRKAIEFAKQFDFLTNHRTKWFGGYCDLFRGEDEAMMKYMDCLLFQQLHNMLKEDSFDRAFQKGCEKGFLQGVKWMRGIRNHRPWCESAIKVCFARACEGNHIATAEWLHHTLDVTYHSADIPSLFTSACFKKNYELASWFIKAFKLTNIGVYRELRHACMNDDAAFFRFYEEHRLHFTVKINVSDEVDNMARINASHALEGFHRAGFMSNIKADDVKRAFATAYRNDSVDVLDWFLTHYFDVIPLSQWFIVHCRAREANKVIDRIYPLLEHPLPFASWSHGLEASMMLLALCEAKKLEFALDFKERYPEAKCEFTEYYHLVMQAYADDDEGWGKTFKTWMTLGTLHPKVKTWYDELG